MKMRDSIARHNGIAIYDTFHDPIVIPVVI